MKKHNIFTLCNIIHRELKCYSISKENIITFKKNANQITSEDIIHSIFSFCTYLKKKLYLI